MLRNGMGEAGPIGYLDYDAFHMKSWFEVFHEALHP